MFYLLLTLFLFSVFYSNTAFNSDISKWNTGAVTDMRQSTFLYYLNCVYLFANLFFLFSVFRDNTAFNSDISKWNTGAVTDMSFSTFLYILFECVFNLLIFFFFLSVL